MPSDQSLQALRDILENARLAREFTAGHDSASFAADRRSVYAVTRCLEIISEASRRLDPSVRDRYPTLPWRAIMGAGNIYRHDYDNVSEEQLWRTITQGLNELVDAVEKEIDADPQ